LSRRSFFNVLGGRFDCLHYAYGGLPKLCLIGIIHMYTFFTTRCPLPTDPFSDTWTNHHVANPQLRFTGQVKLHSILIRTSDSDSAPRTLKVIINREDIDFSSAADAEGTQTFELSRTSEVQELPVRRARFNAVRRLALFIPDNFGDGDEDVTRISYLGFKGEWMQLGRAPGQILYEAAANPSDHKLKGTNVNQMGGEIGGRGPRF
jgi:hypothetical protein